jgi:regulator of sigma E protease
VTIDGLVFAATALAAAVPIIFILVLVHELGHFVTARLAGIRVLEFGIGFPPRARVLARRGEVDYTLNWLPIGGFVRMEGEEQDSDDPRSFNNAGLAKQLVVLVAGVTMNVVAAFFLFFVVAWFFNPTVVLNANYIVPGGAADMAGIPAGARVDTLNGQTYGFISSQDLRDAISSHAGEMVTIGYIDPSGAQKTVTLTLGTDASRGILGVACLGPDAPAGATCKLETVTYNLSDPATAAGTAWDQTVNSLQIIGKTLGDLVGHAASNPGEAPAGVAGPVGIVQAVGLVLTDYGPVILILLAGLLSANLALINVLPIPPFDGGKMVIMVIKRAFGVRAVTNYEIVTNLIGFALLMAFVIWISYFDVVRIGSGG